MATSRYGDKLKGYVAKPEVKNIYAAMKVSAKIIETTESAADFLTKSEIVDTLTKKIMPALATKFVAVAKLAQALGPAGVALGVGVDLMIAFGLLEDATMAKLNQISHQIEQLRDDMRRGFEDLHAKLDTNLALQRFLPIYDKMLAMVQVFEQNVVGDDTNGDILYERLGKMVTDYPPSRIICDLKQMHNLIAGNTGFGKPLFEQLGERGNRLEGKELDDFIPTLLLQFQAVVALEMRAVRMLRSLIAHEEEDALFATAVNVIFRDLALQRREYDPVATYEWYLRFRAFGGTYVMTTTKWPNCYVYMTSVFANVRGKTGHHKGDQGVFIITPYNDGTCLISPKALPLWYMCMPEKYTFPQHTSSLVTIVHGVAILAGGLDVTGGTMIRCRWCFTIKDIKRRIFVLTASELPHYYMYMRGDAIGSVKCDGGDPGPKGHFILTPHSDPDTEWYVNFRALGGTFVMIAIAQPNKHVFIDSHGKVSGDEDPRSTFTIRPCGGGTFLIQTNSWPNWYLHVNEFSGNIMGCIGDPGPPGHWYIDCTNMRERIFILSTALPNLYMYMETNDTADVRAWIEDPGLQGRFILLPP